MIRLHRNDHAARVRSAWIAPLGLLLTSSLFAQTAPENTATIEGVVVDDATGRPLGGVDLYVLPPLERAPGTQRIENFPVVAVSESDGTFALEMPSGRYRLIPILEGHVYSRLSGRTQFVPAGPWVVAEPGERVDEVTIPLVREGAITGQIFDSSGRPLPDVRVQALQQMYDTTGEPRLGALPGAQTVRTDDRGQYRLFGLPPGEYLLRVPRGVPPEYTYYPGTRSESDALPISLGTGEEIRIGAMTIVEPNTQSVRINFTDIATSPTRTWTGLGVSFPNTNGGGVRFVGMPQPGITLDVVEGSHEAVATWPGEDGIVYRMVTLTVGNEPIDLDLVGENPIRTSGSLSLEVDGIPAPADEIRCRLQTGSYIPSRNTGDPNCIDEDLVPGIYTLTMTRIPMDAYVVSATASGTDILGGPFEIDQNVDLDIRVAAPGAAIEGIVDGENGEPVAGATVALVPDAPLRNAGVRYRVVESDIRGRYTLTGIAPGSYKLFAWPELHGAAYLNAEFMSGFEVQGTPIGIEAPETLAVDLTALGGVE